MRGWIPWALLTLGATLLVPVGTAAACSASANGGASFELRVSPRAGTMCLLVVAVHQGASCGGEPTARFEASCGETHRAAITDEGVFVAVLAPRAGGRAWPLVRVFERDGASIVTRTLRLEDLDVAGVAGSRPRARIDPIAIELTGRVPRTIPLAEVVGLARLRPIDRRPRGVVVRPREP